MKKIITGICVIVLIGISFADGLPDLNALQNQAGQAVQQAAQLSVLGEMLRKVSPIQFKSGSSTLDLSDPNFKIGDYNVDQFMKTVAIPALAEVINQLPISKKIAVIGNASQTGSEAASGNFVGNIELSKQRAQAVVAYLKKNSKLDETRFVVVSKGSSNPLSGVDGKDDKNCRVNFDIQ